MPAITEHTPPAIRAMAYKQLRRSMCIYPPGSPDMAQMVADVTRTRAELGEPITSRVDWFGRFGTIFTINSQFGKFAGGPISETFRFRKG